MKCGQPVQFLFQVQSVVGGGSVTHVGWPVCARPGGAWDFPWVGNPTAPRPGNDTWATQRYQTYNATLQSL